MTARRLGLVKFSSSCRIHVIRTFGSSSVRVFGSSSLRVFGSSTFFECPGLRIFEYSGLWIFHVLRVLRRVFESLHLHLITRKCESRGTRRVFPRRALRRSTLVVLYYILGERFVLVSMFSRERKMWCDFCRVMTS